MAERRSRLGVIGRAAAALALLLGAAAAAAGDPDDAFGLQRALAQAGRPEALAGYQLAIPPDEMAALLAFRARILQRDALSPDDRVWVKGKLVSGGQPHRIRLRIRGDLPVHWRGEHWSYRIKFRNHLFEGRKEINLIVPWDKHYGVEWLQTRIAEELDLPFFPARFVNLMVNGKDAGLYLESEHPTRQYLERSGRPPSSIFTFSTYWSQYFASPSHHLAFTLPGVRGILPPTGEAQIKQRGTWDPSDPLLARKQLATAIELHRLLARGTPSEIAERAGDFLDLANFARYVALQDFFGSPHALELNDNVRLYLDPTSGLFEFMPWDTSLRDLAARLQPGVPLTELLTLQDPAFRAVLEGVPGLRAEHDRVLRGLVERGDRYRAELNALHARLIRLYPDDERLRDSAAHIDRQLADNIAMLKRYLDAVGAPASFAESRR